LGPTGPETSDVYTIQRCPEPDPGPGPGDLIVFSNKPDVGVDTEICVMDTSGGSVTQVTANTREDWDPAWSPDRSQIAFVSNSQGAGTSLDLMVVDFDAATATPGEPTPLTDFGGAFSARDPAWSPEPGVRKVAVAVGAAGLFDRISIYDPDQPTGTAPLLEISTGARREVEHLSWNPEGTEIAFCNLGAVYKVAADGLSAPVAINTAPDCWSVDWGPSGFVLHRYADVGLFRLVRTDDAGNNLANVTTIGAFEHSDSTPSWSPMSDRIVFVRRQLSEASPGRLRIVDPDGANNEEIPNQPTGSNTEPDWGFGPLP
jgi:Tol biopolymer transport system component